MDLTGEVIGCAIEVHKQLGPGLLESTYEKCLMYELSLNNININNEVVNILRKNIITLLGVNNDIVSPDL